MNILVITPTYFPLMGGAEKGIYEIYKRIAKNNKVIILTPELDKKLLMSFGVEENFNFRDVEVFYYQDKLNFLKLPGHWKLKGLIPPFSISAIIEASRFIKKIFKPDAVNIFYAIPTGLSGVFIEKYNKIPVILSIIGRDVPGPGIPSFWKFFSRFIAKKVRKTIFISEYCRNALGFDSLFGEVIPFGVDTEKFRPGLDGSIIKKKLNIPENSKVLFSLQRLDIWKRVDILIKAMKIILKSVDVFLVLGGKGPEMENLKRLSMELGVDSRVIFAGYIREEELPLFYSMADIFVFHSTYETFGVVLVQAMASGKPIVSVKSTAIPEVVEKNQCGILVEPLNPILLANAVVELLNDKEKIKQFSENGRKNALEKYDWEIISEKYEEICLSLS